MSEAGYLWMCFGGTEIINACATSNYQSNGHGLEGITCGDCNPCCADLNKALGYGAGGTNISQAPWYDPADARSLEFAGLMVTSIDGLNPGEFTRPITESATTGAILGQARQTAPNIVVTGILLGSCCGVEYGLSWLRNILRGPCAGNSGCQGSELQFLSCVPLFPDEDCPANEGQDYAALLTPYIRSFKGVGLIAGPTITNRISHGCPSCHDCPMLEISFTLAAADPCVYQEPQALNTPVTFTKETTGDCISFVTDGSCSDDANTCGTTDNCATDPDCQDVAPPTFSSTVSTCAVACIAQESWRACFNVANSLIPANGEATLLLDIFSGDLPLRSVRVIGWYNPLGLTPDELDPCDACFGLNISYVAPSSTLEIDGAARTSMITCPGRNTVRANPFISSDTGSPAFSYPVFTGCAEGEYTICIYANGDVSAKAFADAKLISREC